MSTALTDPRNAKFVAVDDRPVTAAKHVHAPHHVPGEHAWNELLHPRDKHGEFTFKGQGYAGAKPIKINTSVIYKTTYQHGQVVAVQKTPHGATRELRWNAHEKVPGSGTPGRFEIWSDYGEPQQGILQSQILGKGQAYDSLKGETGWFAPAKPTVADMKNVLAEHTSSAPPLPETTLTKQVKYFNELDAAQWNKLDVNQKEKLVEQAQSMHDYQGMTGPKHKLETITGQPLDSIMDEYYYDESNVGPSLEDSIAEIQNMNGPDFVAFMNEHFEELQAMWPEAPQSEKDVLIEKAKSLQTNPHLQGFGPGDYSYLDPFTQIHALEDLSHPQSTGELPNFAQMNVVETNDWFGQLDADKYKALSPAAQQSLFEVTQDEKIDHGNTFPGLMLEEIQTYVESEKIGTLTPLQQLANTVDNLGPHDFQTWLYDNIYPESWNNLTIGEQMHLKDWAGIHGLTSVLNDLIAGGSGNVDEHGVLESSLANFKDDAYSISNLEDGPLSQQLLDSFIESVTPDKWMTLDDTTKLKIGNVAGKYGLTGELYAKISGYSTSNPYITTPSVPYVAEVPKTNPYATTLAQVKTVGDIGKPKQVNPAYTGYKTLTKDSAHQLQQDMLKTWGKKWTSEEKSAVASYTTSVGYQTTNAVLRNDEKRMKMFTSAQLQAGADRAVTLQGAMTPLTQSVLLHRGTGAHAFGFPDVNVSFDQLKAFEGKTITDPGFLSTSVVEPTANGVGFDYATKKPIKMLIKAPEGTPGLYVSSATPGYSHENELILGAGTTLRIDSVEHASAAEKKKYGAQIEHIVVATVVPTNAKNPMPKVSGAPAAPVITPSKLTNGGTGTGVPIKLNTKTIHTATYKNGEIVAVGKFGANNVQQLYWDEQKKKFGIRTGDNGGAWHSTQFLSKKDTYDAFKAEPNAVWFAPHPGSTIADEPHGPGLAATAQTPKLAKLSAKDIQAQHGVVPQLLNEQAIDFVKTVKSQSPMGDVKIGATAPTIFKALAYAVAKHNHDNPDSPQLNLLQGVKLLDAKSAPKGENKGLYETKIVDWLQTAAGKKNAQSFADWATAEVGKIPDAASQINPNFKSVDEIGAPNPNISKFGNITTGDAAKMHVEMRAKYGAWNQEQKNAISAYTGSGYGGINSSLRAGKPNAKAVAIQSAMAPVTRSFVAHRGTDSVGTAIKGSMSLEQLKQFVGKTISDPAFLSSSVGPEAAFTGKTFGLDIEVPEGTPAMYAATISSHTHERELLLAAGLKYQILGVEEGYAKGNGRPFHYVIRMRVVAQ